MVESILVLLGATFTLMLAWMAVNHEIKKETTERARYVFDHKYQLMVILASGLDLTILTFVTIGCGLAGAISIGSAVVALLMENLALSWVKGELRKIPQK